MASDNTPQVEESPDETNVAEEASASSAVPTAGELAQQMLADMRRAEKTLARRRRLLLWGGLFTIAVIGPLGFLASTGNLSLRRDEAVQAQPHISTPTATLDMAPLSAGEASDPITQDLRQYVTISIPSLAPYERHAMEDYQSTTQGGMDTAAIVRVIREKVVPEYKLYLQHASAIHPKTPEVQAVHQQYLAVAEHRLAAFTLMGSAKDDKDTSWQKQASREVEAVQKSDKQCRTLLQDLLKKHPVQTSVATTH